jgi:hypothetical protein
VLNGAAGRGDKRRPHGAEMITIRYADLPEGLHAQAERRGRRTVIYLRPGLTAEQRRRGLRRARQSARMGYGPRLPAVGVAQAVARDVVRETAGNLAAALRRHPLGSIALAVGLAAMVSCYTLFVTGSLRLVLNSGPVPAVPRVPHPAVAPRYAGPGPARRAAGPAPGTPGRPEHRAAGGIRRTDAPSPRASRTRPSKATPGKPPGTPAPSRSGAPSPSPSPGPGGLCLTVGPLGVCLP